MDVTPRPLDEFDFKRLAGALRAMLDEGRAAEADGTCALPVSFYSDA